MKVAGLSSAFAVGLASVALANHVDPVHYGEGGEDPENNPSCAYLNPDWNEVKIDQAPNGEYPDSGGEDNPGGDGALVFTVENSDGKTFDWESNIGVDAVVVKGGNRGSNVYFYRPDEATSDTGLHSPDNTKGNRPAVSHISACYDEEAQNEEEPPQEEPPQGQGEEEQPQEEGEEDSEEGGGENERPSEPGDPEEQGSDEEQPQAEEQPQEDADEKEAEDRNDQGGSNERQADEPQDDGAAEPAEEEEGEGESDVEGISETDGESDDIAEETAPGTDDDSGSDGELPFTGAPLGVLLLIGLVLILAGAAVRVGQRTKAS